ncbi:MAG: Mg2+ transporter [Parcubacteria group bacterium GW2011_GWD2_38_12]|nr:MAG: Mg2+ transporter [Parcubacteria group bacterium GW2011_GWC2_36_17]KKQ52888.1 MAG: Mg2+ transporter [Parcubacteria group bacterium GW2011_GWD2_38_12]KKQ59091.1 MAG: Mg2+ transporter [Parcubacteria group bacterium GW2011_GWC1_38_17]KKQ59706.1 MAG: Mg2+ transporter [Parcubacteria group bacterium GW2011_GWD1_38_16]
MFFYDKILVMNNNKVDQQETKYLPPESAGRIMTANIPIAGPSSTIEEIEKLLLEKTKDFETINYIYIVNTENKLVGVTSIKEIFRRPKNSVVSEIMETNLIVVRPHTDRERVALLAIKYNLKSIPVVDNENKFLGIVPSDVILTTLHQENIENVLRSVGIHNFENPIKDLIFASAFTHFKKRFPWLIVGLLGGIIAAVMVGFFENLFAKMVALAAFIPAVVYMADAVGSQTQTILIRSLAIEHNLIFKKYLWRELKVSFFLALILGIVISLVLFLWWSSFLLGFILGISFFITILVASFLALFIPWVFYKFKYDPAIVTGPLATAIRDVLSIILYFAVASVVLRYFL